MSFANSVQILSNLNTTEGDGAINTWIICIHITYVTFCPENNPHRMAIFKYLWKRGNTVCKIYKNHFGMLDRLGSSHYLWGKGWGEQDFEEGHLCCIWDSGGVPILYQAAKGRSPIFPCHK